MRYPKLLLNRAVLLTRVLVASHLAAGAVWAQQPNPLPLDPANLPDGTEAFISQTLGTQLRGVEEPGIPGTPSGLNFQNIGAAADGEYNNIAYDPGSDNRDGGYIYAVEIFGEGTPGGNVGLLRIGEDGSGNIVIQPLGYPGYVSTRDCEAANDATGTTDARMCGTGQYYPRYDAGDIDTDTGKFHVLVQGQVLANTGNTCGTNPSVCTDRVRSFDLDTVWALVPPGASPADLSSAYGVSRVLRNPATDSLYASTSDEADARVADWAYRDGKLYGGDAASGMLAVITANAADDDGTPADDPTPAYFELFSFDATGVASSLDTTIALTADAYGAAWFIDDILYLYKNGGDDNVAPKVYKIDLQIGAVTPGEPFPKIIEVVEAVDVVTRNDGASYIAQDDSAFECTGEPFIVFDHASQLNQIDLDPGASTFTFNIIANPINGNQINNLGFRSTDGYLYGWERNAADNGGQIVRIDTTGAVTPLGQPNPPLPANQTPSGCTPGSTCTAFNYNAGDVSVDGSEMFLSYSVRNGAGDPLYIVDLTSPTPLPRTEVTISGDSGQVADWAAHPINGLLYGGDHTDAELAVLDPDTGARTDVAVAGLLDPANGQGFGAAWFDASGLLYLYDNNGIIYAIDDVDTTPTLVGGGYPLVNAALDTTNNDGANCAAPPECTPVAEDDVTCDGVDDDCDGQFDEDYAPMGTVCGVGECGSTGLLSCVDGQVVDSCQPGEPGTELCGTGLDEDCDDEVDEGFNDGEACSEGLGECAADGAYVCTGDRLGTECNADASTTDGAACGSDADTACTDPDTCDGSGVCQSNNQPCGGVTDSSLCFFDVQPDKGMCTVSNVACLVDPACEAAGGKTCADGTCLDADGYALAVACTDDCTDEGDHCEQTGQFRLLFTPDVQSFPGYKLPASNPGQTFYNLIVEGDEGTTVPVTMRIPYPYVTVGGQPVHVYADSVVVGACVGDDGSTGEQCRTDTDCGQNEACDSSCFAPGDALQQFDAQWTIEDWVLGDGSGGSFTDSGLGWSLICDPVCGPEGSGTCDLTVDVVIPDTDAAYVNIHLDYGLKGNGLDANPCDDGDIDRYDQGASSGTLFAEVGFDALVNTDDQTGDVAIADCTDYNFSHTDGIGTFDDSVQNLNVFKPIAGAFGRCAHDNNGQPCDESTLVELVDASGEVVQSSQTDEDGFWATPYKHKGKPADYSVWMYDPGCLAIAQIIELRGNGWANVDFDASTCTSTAEYGTGPSSGGGGKK